MPHFPKSKTCFKSRRARRFAERRPTVALYEAARCCGSSLAGMTGLAVLAALWPLAFRRKGGAEAASEVAFYKAQLAEIERDVERGQLPAEEAAGARAEAARRLIAASAAAPAEAPPAKPRRPPANCRRAHRRSSFPLVALGLYAGSGPAGPARRAARRPHRGRRSARASRRRSRSIEAHLAASPDDGRAGR